MLRFANKYTADLPNMVTLNVELDMWEIICTQGHLLDSKENPYKTICGTLKDARVDPITFFNVLTILKILAVFPVTSCEAERSISTLRRAVTWLRSTMKSDRLNGLAAMNINNDVEVDFGEFINDFARKYPRRIQFAITLEDECIEE